MSIDFLSAEISLINLKWINERSENPNKHLKKRVLLYVYLITRSMKCAYSTEVYLELSLFFPKMFARVMRT